MADWVTISSLATAGGTLVLTGATFASVRSRCPSPRGGDEAQKVHFADGRIVATPGGGAGAEVGEEAVYLTLSIRPLRRLRRRSAGDQPLRLLAARGRAVDGRSRPALESRPLGSAVTMPVRGYTTPPPGAFV